MTITQYSLLSYGYNGAFSCLRELLTTVGFSGKGGGKANLVQDNGAVNHEGVGHGSLDESTLNRVRRRQDSGDE